MKPPAIFPVASLLIACSAHPNKALPPTARLTVPVVHAAEPDDAPVDEAPTAADETPPLCVGAPADPAATSRPGPRMVCCHPNRERVLAAIREERDAFRRCYQEGLARVPTLAGRVGVRMTVAENGAVVRACDAGTTLADADVLECVLVAALSVRMDPNPHEQCPRLEVIYPVQFVPGGDPGSEDGGV